MARSAPTDGPDLLRWRVIDEERAPRLISSDERWTEGRDELAGLELMHVRAKRLINGVPAGARLPFRWTVNAYRGCSHACVYCFARPTHEYLGLGIGEDFERRLVVKVNAVERLRVELAAPGWRGEGVAMGTNTDPYQPCEGRYRLTRGLIGAFADAANPFSILTKSPLILRDLDLLRAAAERAPVSAALSIGTLDRGIASLTEPHAPSPAARMGAVARLNAAGIPCGVLIAPVIPGIGDDEDALHAVVGAAVEAGAGSIAGSLLHLRPRVRAHVMGWMTDHRPDLVPAYRARYSGSGYAPGREQRTLDARIRRLVIACGGTPGPIRPATASRSRPADRQLRLL